MKKAMVFLVLLTVTAGVYAEKKVILDFEDDTFLKSNIEVTSMPLRIDPVLVGGIPGQDSSINLEPVKDFDPKIIPVTRVSENATSGKSAAKVTGNAKEGFVVFVNFDKNWDGFESLKIDIFNPTSKTFGAMIVINDNQTEKDGKLAMGKYGSRLDINKIVKPGKNTVDIELSGMTTNDMKRSLDLKNITRFAIDLPGRAYFVDNIRLENAE